ncbi:hypothetical protein KVR01_008350 [Diaporthe batatas]|uniref:uncharacterized protein n=1 Tax=Diaporthe batatas TaxID=748121 RepID=UPI001D051AF7|nr:uncharacterized protein KVR01_008350 [Diaporthe batatas]KAG8162585.1 hypothetical protein KVR01_008350 [Diaporthe batatas]
MDPPQQYAQPYQAQSRHARFPSDGSRSDQSDDTVFGGLTAYDPAAIYLNSEYHTPKANNIVENTAIVDDAATPGLQARNATFGSDDISKESKSGTKYSRLSSSSKLKNIRVPRKTGSWFWEVVATIFAIGAVASIIALLARYEGQPLPKWPYAITLNALIAVLTTVANAAMAVPLSSGLGQLKWERMKNNYARLVDMEVLDEASRGAWGAINMLVRLRGGLHGSLGAVAVIVALFLSPFAQQVVVYRTLPQKSEAGATNYRAMNFTVALPSVDSTVPFVPVLPIKSAVYNGLFAENNKPWTSLPVSCETGNCTWEPFDTLAVCNTCTDMTPFLQRDCATGDDDCGWKLMSGPVLQGGHVFSMTSQFLSTEGGAPWSNIMKLTFMGTESNTAEAGNTQPWARQCVLSACVQTIKSQIINGNLVENVTHTVENKTVVASKNSMSELAPIVVTAHNTTSPATEYLLSAEAMLGTQTWFAQLFANGSATRTDSAINKTLKSPDDAPIAVNLTVGISSGATFFDTDIVQAFYWNYYEYPHGLDMLMDDLSVSLTVAFRSLWGSEAVNGTAFRNESFVFVRWGFITPLVLSVALTAAFLAQAVYRSWRSDAKLWKSSVLAVLFHGLEPDVRERFDEVGEFELQRQIARDVKVRLDEEVAAGGLLRAQRVY